MAVYWPVRQRLRAGNNPFDNFLQDKFMPKLHNRAALVSAVPRRG